MVVCPPRAPNTAQGLARRVQVNLTMSRVTVNAYTLAAEWLCTDTQVGERAGGGGEVAIWVVGIWTGQFHVDILKSSCSAERTSPRDRAVPRTVGGADPHQDVQAGSLEEGDLVGNGEGGETGQLLGELHSLNDALGGEFTELVPEVNVQRHTLF